MKIKTMLGESIQNRIAYLVEDIMKRLDQYDRLFIIVPEQFNFSMQKRMLEALPQSAIGKLEILSFQRLYHRIFEKEGITPPMIHPFEKTMALSNIIRTSLPEFSFFNTLRLNENITLEIVNIINLIEQNHITEESLASFLRESSEETILYKKIQDIWKINRCYRTYLKEKGYFSSGYAVLEERVEELRLLKNAKIYISEFYYFTKEQMNLLNLLSSKASLEVLMQADLESCNPLAYLYAPNLFLQSNQFEMEKIEKGVPNRIGRLVLGKGVERDEHSIFLTRYKTRQDELREVATQIVWLIRDEGYRLKEICVVCKEITSYETLLRDLFTTFDIPYYLAINHYFKDTRIFRTLEKLNELIQTDFSRESMLLFIKEVLPEAHLINFDFFLERNHIDSYDKLVCCTPLRDYHYDLVACTKMKDELLEITKGLERSKKYAPLDLITLLKGRFEKKLGFDPEDSETKVLFEAWETLASFFQGEITLNEFMENCRLILLDKKITEGFPTLDQVSVFGEQSVNVLDTKILFLVGFSENGVQLNRQTLFFSEIESHALDSHGILFNKRAMDLIGESRFLFYNMVDKVGERLYISYVDNKVGMKIQEDMRISELVRKVSINEAEKKEALINDRVRFLYLRQSKNFTKERIIQIKDKEKLGQMVRFRKQDEIILSSKEEELTLSASRLETYARCPFLYFVNYALYVTEPYTGEIDAKEIGNIVHKVLEKVFTELKERQMREDEIEGIVDATLKQEMRERGEDRRAVYIMGRLKDLLLKNVLSIVDQYTSGKFEVKEIELEFNDNKEIKALELTTAQNQKIKVVGKIDRVDEYGDYVRIIDYKTGKTSFRLLDVENGFNLQLGIYLSVLSRNIKGRKLKPAGVFLLPIHLKNAKDTKDEASRLSGILLDDQKILEAMDWDYRNSSFLPVKFKVDGEYHASVKDNLFGEKDFEDYIEAVEKKICEFAEKILDAIYTPKPAKINGVRVCRYCLFDKICEKS